MILKSGIKLYHGSYSKIEKIDLSKCNSGKDFGIGFYLTTDYEQAVKFINTSLLKAKKNNIIEENVNFGFVNEFIFTESKKISIFDFKKADKKWLHYVAANRKTGLFDNEIEKFQKFDIITGKIANDATNRVITAYINNIYGEVGTETADKTAINLLLPNKLSDQICFKTQNAISCLTFGSAKEIFL